MEKENTHDDEKLKHNDANSNERNDTDVPSEKDEGNSGKDVKSPDPNKSKKGHISDLNEIIEKTERRYEDLNKSIAGNGIFDF